MEDYIEQFGFEWPVAIGGVPALDAMGVTAYPSMFVINPDGETVWNSRVPGMSLEDAIEQALN